MSQAHRGLWPLLRGAVVLPGVRLAGPQLGEGGARIDWAPLAGAPGNPAEAADKATATVDNAQGRVDSRSTDAGSGAGRARTSMVLRVPAAKLDDVMRDLAALGTVEHAEVNTDDVTAQRVDLDARIKALQTSVDRLLAIMRDARDPDALIKAEDALSSRQAELQSLQAQRDTLRDQITDRKSVV